MMVDNVGGRDTLKLVGIGGAAEDVVGGAAELVVGILDVGGMEEVVSIEEEVVRMLELLVVMIIEEEVGGGSVLGTGGGLVLAIELDDG